MNHNESGVRSVCCQSTGTGGPSARTTDGRGRGMEGRRYVWEETPTGRRRAGRGPPSGE